MFTSKHYDKLIISNCIAIVNLKKKHDDLKGKTKDNEVISTNILRFDYLSMSTCYKVCTLLAISINAPS